MDKPKSYVFNGRAVWSGSQRDMVRWLLWDRGVLRSADVRQLLHSVFGADVSQANVSTMLTTLLGRGELQNPVRGLYIDPKSPAARDAVDIFS